MKQRCSVLSVVESTLDESVDDNRPQFCFHWIQGMDMTGAPIVSIHMLKPNSECEGFCGDFDANPS